MKTKWQWRLVSIATALISSAFIAVIVVIVVAVARTNQLSSQTETENSMLIFSLLGVAPSTQPTSAPSTAPSIGSVPSLSISPSFSPSISISYDYQASGTSRCSKDNENNWQGPTPTLDNTVLQFFAFGDSPYDGDANTCIGTDGLPQNPCTRYDCTKINTLQKFNTCTYKGPQYLCLKNKIIPYMNDKLTNGEAAFALHIGDIIKGQKPNKRCSAASFESRKTLFSQCPNFLIVPGDNEWTDCVGYDINSNSDEMRELWRDTFANELSPFHQFSNDFPSGVGGDRPNIIRQESNPENLFFTYNGVGVFGLNQPAGENYIENRSPFDINAQWIEDNLDEKTCNLKSIVLFGHTNPSSEVNAKLLNYYNACSTIPTLVINGNDHPSTYCMKKADNRLTLTVEAFQSGPLLVSIVHDTDGYHFFHVQDKDFVDSNDSCPDLSQMTD